ncbi:hypothetical protein Egran_06105 [Elaphomyces granulatus]|uniref:SWIM-type domain-containing protein n=1 Tax=Elaphomyces granulatus TaxID=519963 RepID=A0A232LQR1_9EURO|nr:hypothetical protein Egran_06105 [Elaphomyces granulatus]
MEPARGEEQETVLQMFSRHFHAHTFIPDQNGTHKTPKQLHRDSATEMYIWCRSRNYFRLWAYLWVNWYSPKEWALWARSTNEKEIPILKTTMIVESHWRKIKHDYLHRFNRPRLDLVVWVLLSRSIPDSVRNMQAILDREHRIAIASWRKAFKREWKAVTSRLNDSIPSSIQRYHTDASNFTCACPDFLRRRFAICKHILFCYEPIAVPDRRRFFQNVERRRTLPLWAHELLVLRPEYCRPSVATVFGDVQDDEDKGESDQTTMSEDEDEEDSDPTTMNEDEDIEDDSGEHANDRAEEAMDQFERDVQSAMVFFCEQRANGNKRFAEAFMSSVGPSISTFVKEVTAYRNQCTMSRTWEHYGEM